MLCHSSGVKSCFALFCSIWVKLNATRSNLPPHYKTDPPRLGLVCVFVNLSMSNFFEGHFIFGKIKFHTCNEIEKKLTISISKNVLAYVLRLMFVDMHMSKACWDIQQSYQCRFSNQSSFLYTYSKEHVKINRLFILFMHWLILNSKLFF